MTNTLLLLGRTPFDPEAWRVHVSDPNTRLVFGTSLEEARRHLDKEDVRVVIMGAGLPLDLRLEVVQAVFESGDGTTVHLKDRASGKAGMVPFVQGVIRGLASVP